MASRSPVLVALSGGPDSSALLLWLLEQGVRLEAAHFDHDLRADSAADAVAVAGFCSKLGVRLHTSKRTRPLPAGSRQAAARHLRYEFLEQVRVAAGAEWVAMGHTADDLVEGVVLHLLRGSGLAGLRGMPEQRGPYVRPFLNVWKSELEAYLSARGVVALADPSNLDTSHARVRVRLHLLPRLESASPGISRTLHRVARLAGLVQQQLEFKAGQLQGTRRCAIALAPRPVRIQCYRQLYAAAGGTLPALGRRQLVEMDRLTTSGRTGSSLNLPAGLVFRLLPEYVEISRPMEPQPRTLVTRECDGCGDPQVAHLDPTLVLPAELRLGRRSPGLRLRPNRNSGTRKLQDLLTDARVPRHQRDGLPLVFAGATLAWVPGVAVEHSLKSKPGFPALHVQLDHKTAVSREEAPGTNAKIQEPISR